MPRLERQVTTSLEPAPDHEGPEHEQRPPEQPKAPTSDPLTGHRLHRCTAAPSHHSTVAPWHSGTVAPYDLSYALPSRFPEAGVRLGAGRALCRAGGRSSQADAARAWRPRPGTLQR